MTLLSQEYNSQKNRVFDHAKGALKPTGDEQESLRQATIRKIIGLGLEPIHVIHRHGMSEEEAKAVEAALIDAYPGLTNIMPGDRSNDYGPANANELAKRYEAKEIEFDPNHKILVIKIKWSTIEEKGSVYEAVRSSWKVGLARAKRAEYVLAIVDGICKGIFIPDDWHATDEKDRYEFEGEEVTGKFSKMYLDKRIPDRMRKKGMASPFLYVRC